MKSLDPDTLARLLARAKEAHIEYEEQLGHDDDDWPMWYAEYILERLEEEDE